MVLLFPITLFSQNKGPGTISGLINDSQTNMPVEYANIVLKDSKTGKMITGLVSDSAGYFKLKDIPIGTYIIEYSFIGYDKKSNDTITFTAKDHHFELGSIRLTPSSLNMEEVTITGDKVMMINKIDRKVFNVQKDIQAQTGTVSDVLQNIPSVAVDMDGNISLRGSGSVTLLINGRPSVMATSANLEQMPASLVERIEVITNPSAKYKPDGTGGIINIILKKEQKGGLNSILGLNVGNKSRFNSNLQVNYNTGKMNLFGSYGYRQDYRWRKTELNSQTIDTITDNSLYLDQTSEGDAHPVSHLGQFGIEYNIDKNDFAGISGTFNLRKVNRSDSTYNFYRDSMLEPLEEYTRHHSGNEDENSLGLNANYEHIFNRENEHTFRADFEYEQDAESEDDVYNNIYVLPPYPDEKNRSLAKNSESNLNLALNYNRPLQNDAVLESGYEGNVQLADQNQEVSYWDPDKGEWIDDPEQGNRFYSNQTVHALYSTYSNEWGKFRMMAGIRAEETLLNLEFRTLDTVTRSDYFAIYPTLHLGVQMGENEWQLNYSRRVNRPDGEDMNPVPEYRDPRNYFVGNPDLKPEDIHSIELGFSYRYNSISLIPTLFYRYKVNGFSMYNYTINDTVMVTTLANLATDQSAGLDFSGSMSLKKIMTVNFSASAFYNQIDASNLGYEENKSAFSWNSKLNVSANITKTTIFQVNSQYRSKALTAQGMRDPSWVMNLGLRQDLWKKKVSLIATVSDVFDTQKMSSSVNTPVLVQESMRRRDGRVIYAGVTINLGTNGKKNNDPKFEFDNGMER